MTTTDRVCDARVTPGGGQTTAAVVDCDVHPVLVSPRQFAPYLDPYWADSLRLQLYPNYTADYYHPFGSAIAQRPGLRVDENGRAGTRVEDLVADVFADGFADYAILNPLYGIQQIKQPRREAAHARALNTWLAEEWLSADHRLRGSIVVPMGTPDLAAEEIEHWASDDRFVQVLLLAHSELLLGRRINWPIWAAAEHAGLPVAIHLGTMARQPPTTSGWPSTHIEWYVTQQSAAESQLASIVMEGVFNRFPETKIVVSELGFAWYAPFLWKLEKVWKSYRVDVPWISEYPGDYYTRHVKFTTAPADGAQESGALDRAVDRMGSDAMLVYASDYPHRHHSGPLEIDGATSSPELLERIWRGNASDLYGLTIARTTKRMS